MMQRISGPIHGYYIAAYACAMGNLENENLGYFKISLTPPGSYWQSMAVAQDCTESPKTSPLDALCEAEAEAYRAISMLPGRCDSSELQSTG